MSQIRANDEFHETHGLITSDGELVTTTNPLPVTLSQSGSGLSVNSTFGLDVARGLVDGMTGVFKAGYNEAFANGTEESFWSHSEIYPWSAWSTPGTLSLVSSSTSDTGTILIMGLNASTFESQTETITLNGTTPVVTSLSYARLNYLHYSGTSNTNVGEIHANRNGTCVGHIAPQTGIAQGAQYTIPAGYTGYMLQGTANIGKGNDGKGYFKYRPYGSSFQHAMTFLLYQSTFDYTFAVPLPLPEKTDIDVTMVASNSGTAATCEYSLLLVANTEE